MTRRSALALAAVVLLCAALPASLARAGGPSQFPMDITASSNTAASDGASKITFTIFIYGYYCASGNSISETPVTCSDGSASVKKAAANHQIGIYPSGSGNIFGGTQTESNGVRYVVSGADGKAQFTLASTVAESKTLQFTDFVRNSPYAGAPSKTVTFAAPSAPAPPKPTTTSTTQTRTSTPVAEPAPPATPTPTGFEVNGQTVAGNEKPTVEQNKPFVLKGTTVPNGIVKLYIFSTPREATVTADGNGNWSYEVKDLEPGSHHVEAEVTDPKTQKTSERKTLAEFTIAAAPAATAAPAVVSAKPVRNMKPLALAIIVVVIALLGGAVWWFVRHKKAHDAVQNEAATTEASNEGTIVAPTTVSPSSDNTPSADDDANSGSSSSSDEPPKSN